MPQLPTCGRTQLCLCFVRFSQGFQNRIFARTRERAISRARLPEARRPWALPSEGGARRARAVPGAHGRLSGVRLLFPAPRPAPSQPHRTDHERSHARGPGDAQLATSTVPCTRVRRLEQEVACPRRQHVHPEVPARPPAVAWPRARSPGRSSLDPYCRLTHALIRVCVVRPTAAPQRRSAEFLLLAKHRGHSSH